MLVVMQEGCSALMQASNGGHLAVVEYLVEHGADINAMTRVSLGP